MTPQFTINKDHHYYYTVGAHACANGKPRDLANDLPTQQAKASFRQGWDAMDTSKRLTDLSTQVQSMSLKQ